jgi:hypothetical protein
MVGLAILADKGIDGDKFSRMPDIIKMGAR